MASFHEIASIVNLCRTYGWVEVSITVLGLA